MDKICKNCHQPNPSNALFCRHCAAALAEGNAQSSANQAQFQNPPNPQPNQYQNQQSNQQQNQPWNAQNLGGGQINNNFATPTDSASSRAMGAAALAVVSFICCGIFAGIPAALLGWLELTAIKEGRASSKGMLFAQIGFWGGIAGSIITTLIQLVLMLFSGRG